MNMAVAAAAGMNTSMNMDMRTAAVATRISMNLKAADVAAVTIMTILMTTAIPMIMAADVDAVTTTGIPVRAEA